MTFVRAGILAAWLAGLLLAGWPALAQPPAVLVVAVDGSGDFADVQVAVDAVPAASTRPVVIHIKPGVYKARVTIPKDKPRIALVGDDAATTVITAAVNAHTPGPGGKETGTFNSATVFIYADDFSAENITFENASGNHGQALAIHVAGDRAVFRRCRFLGWQDTVLLNKGRQYFQDCTIAGHVDFIFGGAAAFFQGCEIHCLADGYITAASTPRDQPFGMVFRRCKVTAELGVKKVFLGRPWRPYASVAFLDAELPAAIRYDGWDTWNGDLTVEKTARFAEYHNSGPGANPAERPKWITQLTDDQAGALTAGKVLSGSDGWDPLASPSPCAQGEGWGEGSSATTRTTSPTSDIPRPIIPEHTVNITDFGAVGDGKTLNTAAIQAALDSCRAAGGGTIHVPAGKFLTGPIVLASNMNLCIAQGATLLLSNDPAGYTLNNGRYQPCIAADDCHDIAITGGGTIDGQGQPWWGQYRKPPPGDPPPDLAHPLPRRPYLVAFNKCTRVLVREVSLINSPSFHLVPARCQDVTVDGVRITAPDGSPNTDGIDPSGHDILITRCDIDVGDDCIAIKAGGDVQHPSCQDITISDCIFRHGHGLSVGSETFAGLRNLTVRNCRFIGTQAGIRLKSARGNGGLVENLSYANLVMQDVKVPIVITSYYPHIPDAPETETQPITATTPIWRHIRIAHLTATGSASAGRIVGLPEMPATDIQLTDVNIAAAKGMEIIHARDVRFEKSAITANAGTPLQASDAEVTGLEAAK